MNFTLHCVRRPLGAESGGVILDTVLVRYSQECGIGEGVLQNFPADAVAVLVYIRIRYRY